ncbi:MAG TPA: carboxyl transferase domain-containing protein [Dehalococcoidia bacterium]|nr:carboxyl transferase domain-containing protein [Dehalococcoidia bacterium]
MRLLVANRGEIAVRILRAAAELGVETVAVYSEDDAQSLHVRRADAAQALRGRGVRAYLDIEQIIAAALAHGCDAVHPGYGFLSEQAEFARACEDAGLKFVGPTAETLEIFGDKTRARDLARECSVPVLGGTGPIDAVQARAFLESFGQGGSMVIKAVAGGGGRGMRVVRSLEEVDAAWERCRSEAEAAFGNGAVYAEELMPKARHVEVQVIGDGRGAVAHLWERECSLQRRHQKVIEIAPSPGLAEEVRARLLEDAVRMAQKVSYRSAGTFEFLVDAAGGARYAFIEANARLQVEHTVTEEVLGVDIVKAQLRLAMGASLAEVGLRQDQVPAPRGFAVQARVNMETIDRDGSVRPSAGVIAGFEPPGGPAVRVDTMGYTGYRVPPAFDSLLAKVVGYSAAGFEDAVAVTSRALREFGVAGVRTNIGFLLNVLRHPDFVAGRLYTDFIEDHLAELVETAEEEERRLKPAEGIRVGAKVDAIDPLAVLNYGKTGGAEAPTAAAVPEPLLFDVPVPEGMVAVRAPVQATIVSIDVREGDLVRAGEQLLVLNAMKMEHVLRAPVGGIVHQLLGAVGDSVAEGAPLLFMEEQEVGEALSAEPTEADLDRIRPDLAEVERRRALTTDEARAEAVAEHHARARRTARENIADLVDPGSFLQYGSLVVPQGLQGTVDELLQYAPSDGMVMGLAQVNRDLFGPEKSRCVVMSYDYTVLAGTQGGMNHRMIDRMFETAAKLKTPVILFAEGGGGRAGGGSRGGPTGGRPENAPGQISGGGGLGVPSWKKLSDLSALVPLVGIVSGRCFAGNAALLGICDVIIATPDATIGMGGPAMIEGGGLGVYRPEEVGPVSVQVPNGVIDILAQDEAEAVRVAKKYLSYFQGRVGTWEAADQRKLRNIIPENRLRVYDVRQVIETLADKESVLELRRDFGRAMITALVRIEGRPLGVVANNPLFNSGAIDSPAADKAARFLQLCDAFDLPVLMLCDTPGIMVGPEAEKTALVRHANRMFVVGSTISVPVFTIVLRKAYGLGAQTMGGGNHRIPVFTLAWPTGEFGGMGLEGQVKLGRRRELEAIDDPVERRERFERYVEQAYARGKAINAGHVFEVDDVIDPADSRRWLSAGLESLPPPPPRVGKKRPCIDAW